MTTYVAYYSVDYESSENVYAGNDESSALDAAWRARGNGDCVCIQEWREGDSVVEYRLATKDKFGKTIEFKDFDDFAAQITKIHGSNK